MFLTLVWPGNDPAWPEEDGPAPADSSVGMVG
jgi:hypothetical protein